MTPVEKLHYALGEIAYAMVWADAPIKKDEVNKFMETITYGLEIHNREFDLLGTLFSAITGEKKDAETTYASAMANIKKYGEYLHPQMKKSFVTVLEHVESTYAPFTVMNDNASIVDRFRKDIDSIKGTRVFMGHIFLN